MPRKNGFTLIEILVATAVLVIFLGAVLTITQLSIQALGEARVRSTAIQLAQDRLELARNLAYERIGTIGGIPSGDLIQSESVTRLGTLFTIDTVVIYIDDPFDGTAPTDILPTDYKRVRVSVSWQGAFQSKKPVVVMMDMTPPGLESDSGGGTLSVVVFNSLGLPVSNAMVTVAAPTLTPPISMTLYTDVYGRAILPGAPVCATCYQVEVSKAGYSTERTYGMEEVANPAKPHVTILEAQLSEISFAIDTVSSLTIKTTRSATYGYSPFSGAQVIVRGNKEIGRDTEDEPVYKVTETVTTGAGGLATISNLDWDTYVISFPPLSSIDFAGSWPFNPVTVTAGQTANVSIILEAATDTSFLVQVSDSSMLPVESAQIELSRAGFVATASTGISTQGDYSQSFFPNLVPSTYSLTIQSPGFDIATSSVSISGDMVEKYIISRP